MRGNGVGGSAPHDSPPARAAPLVPGRGGRLEHCGHCLPTLAEEYDFALSALGIAVAHSVIATFLREHITARIATMRCTLRIPPRALSDV